MSRVKLKVELVGRMGIGAAGAAELCALTDSSGERMFGVRKKAGIAEIDVMRQLTCGEDAAEQPFIPKLLETAPVPGRRRRRAPKQYYMTTEACELGSLAQQSLLEKVKLGKVSRQAYLAYVMQTVLLQTTAALEYVHARGVLHCDVKPQNVFLTAAGKVKLGDFGHHMPCELDKTVEVPDSHMVGVGTLAYVPPESVASFIPNKHGECSPMTLNGRSDIWSLGVTLGYMIEHEVGLVPIGMDKDISPQAAFFKVGTVAQAKIDEPDAWIVETKKVTIELQAYYKDRAPDHVYDVVELQRVLELLSQLLTAPAEMRPTSRELLVLLQKVMPFVPQVEVVADDKDESALHQRRIKAIAVADPRVLLAAMASPSAMSISSGQSTPPVPSSSPMSISSGQSTPLLPPLLGCVHRRQMTLHQLIRQRKRGVAAPSDAVHVPSVEARVMLKSASAPSLSSLGPRAISLRTTRLTPAQLAVKSRRQLRLSRPGEGVSSGAPCSGVTGVFGIRLKALS